MGRRRARLRRSGANRRRVRGHVGPRAARCQPRGSGDRARRLPRRANGLRGGDVTLRADVGRRGARRDRAAARPDRARAGRIRRGRRAFEPRRADRARSSRHALSAGDVAGARRAPSCAGAVSRRADPFQPRPPALRGDERRQRSSPTSTACSRASSDSSSTRRGNGCRRSSRRTATRRATPSASRTSSAHWHCAPASKRASCSGSVWARRCTTSASS